MSNTIKPINKESQELASKVWEVVTHAPSLRKLDLGVTLAPIVTSANKVEDIPIGDVTEVPRDVLITAKFIANLEPSYKNANGKSIHLKQIRAMVEVPEDKLPYLVNQFRQVVESRITVTSGEESLTHKLKINSSLSKKKLIERAVIHLITGSEVVKDVEVYNLIKSTSLMQGGYIHDYLHLAGLANLLRFKSVPAMMDAFVLNFQDQAKSIKETGLLTFYDATVVRVPIGG